MKKIKVFISIFLVLCLTLCFTGCNSNRDNNLKDIIVNGFDSWMQSFSKHALTKDKNLQGDKKKGVDEYTGSYSAEYDEFNGEEFIFGGTALERGDGSNLKVTYSLKIASGYATLYWIASGKELTISSENSDDVYNLTLGFGDNYIVLKGEKFSGSLELMVEDVED